jgi:6,7-dimethyl-8-ribityllumazine synthase
MPRRALPARVVTTCGDSGVSFDPSDGSNFRIGIVWTRWNSDLVTPMVEDVRTALKACKVEAENIVEMQVPGAFEVPMAARLMTATQKVNAIVCIGVLVKGETDHYDYIAGPVSQGLMDLQLTASMPIIFGILTCPDRATAEARSIGDKSNAADWAKTAVEMAALRASQMSPSAAIAGKKSVGF